ncbi:hypothetical protein B1P84_01235 [Enterococcus faecium]|nr:hypothetical protein B1P84_01235 [Enterococcus faecium]
MLLLLFLNHHSIAKTNLFVNVFHTVCLPFLKMIRLADFLAVIPDYVHIIVQDCGLDLIPASLLY